MRGSRSHNAACISSRVCRDSTLAARARNALAGFDALIEALGHEVHELSLQDKIDRMTTLSRRPTEVRLTEEMLENFKRQVMVSQTQMPV